MFIYRINQVLFILLSFLTVCSPTFATAISLKDNIVFDNFSEKVTLIKHDTAYQIKNTTLFVKLAPRVIVKTTIRISKEAAYYFHPHIENVVTLFTGTNHNYYSLELSRSAKLHLVIAHIAKNATRVT